MATGEIFVVRLVLRKRETSSDVSGLAIHPRGLREKICTVSHPVSLAMISAWCSPPLIGAWNPMRGRLFVLLAAIENFVVTFSKTRLNTHPFRVGYLCPSQRRRTSPHF